MNYVVITVLVMVIVLLLLWAWSMMGTASYEDDQRDQFLEERLRQEDA